MRTDSKGAPPRSRIIVDTNVIISAILFKGETIRSVLLLALNEYQLVFSQATWDELASVLQREGFEKFMPLGARLRILSDLASRIELIPSHHLVTDCRDPKDNKFLSLALDAGATLLVTGDEDLKVLHPYRGLGIVSPAQFMRHHALGS